MIASFFAMTGIGPLLIPAILNPLRLTASAMLYQKGIRQMLPMADLFPE